MAKSDTSKITVGRINALEIVRIGELDKVWLLFGRSIPFPTVLQPFRYLNLSTRDSRHSQAFWLSKVGQECSEVLWKWWNAHRSFQSAWKGYLKQFQEPRPLFVRFYTRRIVLSAKFGCCEVGPYLFLLRGSWIMKRLHTVLFDKTLVT